MRVPSGFLDNLANFAPPPRPRYFADGGMVPGGPAYSATVGKAAAPMIVNFYVDGKDLLSDDQINRKIVPALDRLMRRSK